LAYHVVGYRYEDYYQRSYLKSIVAQDERKALRWATNVLMPDLEFLHAVRKGNSTVYSLADYFDVEEWFVLAKIGFIRVQARESGGKIKWRDIIKREQPAPTFATPCKKGFFDF